MLHALAAGKTEQTLLAKINEVAEGSFPCSERNGTLRNDRSRRERTSLTPKAYVGFQRAAGGGEGLS